MSGMLFQEMRRPVLATALQWCRDHIGTFATAPNADQDIRGGCERPPETRAASETPEPPSCFFDASLLFRCMDRLQIDWDQLANDDPLLFRELQGRCALCRSKEECVGTLAQGFDDPRWDRWRQYCPISTMLTVLGAVQNCGRAAQHLKMPRSIGLSDLP